jgi:hypothetical protein
MPNFAKKNINFSITSNLKEIFMVFTKVEPVKFNFLYHLSNLASCLAFYLPYSHTFLLLSLLLS